VAEDPDQAEREVVPWATWAPARRRFGVDDLRRAARHLPPPRRWGWAEGVAQPRPAAAMVPVVDLDGEAAVVATKRPSSMAYHRDDWVFPGGRIEPGESARDAAVRELEEELGVPRSHVEVLGELDTHGPFVTGFVLSVFVGIVPDPGELRPDPREVEAMLIVPVSRLLADGAYYRDAVPGGQQPGPMVGTIRRPLGRVRFFDIGEGHTMWATQADILWNLLTHVVATGA